MKHGLFVILAALSVVAHGCGGTTQKRVKESAAQTHNTPLKYYTYRIVAELPHSTSDYTQGFEYADGLFWEGTGGYGSSQLKCYDPATGRVERSVDIPKMYFGEGITLLNGKIYQLTWRKGKAFVYDQATLRKLGEFDYEGEGWGLATDGKVLYMSDGTDKITLRDPETFKPIGSMNVTIGGRKVQNINELEWIGSELWANVYLTDQIIRIDPATGKVVGIVELSGIQAPQDVTYNTDVLNGIAHDPATGRLWLTGKNWNKVYQVEIVEQQ